MNPATKSLYCDTEVLSEGEDSESLLLRRLLELASREATTPVLFATSDYFVDFMVRSRLSLSNHFRFMSPDIEVLRALTEKLHSFRAAQAAGLYAPWTISLRDFLRSRQHGRFPCIAKANHSRVPIVPWKTRIVRSHQDVMTLVRSWPSAVDGLVLQEVIPGPESSIFQCTSFTEGNGEGPCVTVQKLRQFPVQYGMMSIGRSRNIPELEVYARQLLRSLAYEGFLSIEFKRSAKDGRFYFIEANPRLPWYNSLFRECGVNLVVLAYRRLTEGKESRDSTPRQRDGVYWIHLRNEVAGVFRRAIQGMPIDVLDCFGVATRARAFALFDVQDLKPFLSTYLGYFKQALGTVLAKTGRWHCRLINRTR